MAVNTQAFTTLVQNAVSSITGRAAQLVDTTVGSVLRVLAEAFAAQLLWIQSLIMQVLATTRASTSTGSDLDTWMADYGLTRLPAVPATGLATFARYTDTLPAYVTPTASLNSDSTVSGTAAIESSDGTQLYGILTDTGNACWNATLGQYVIPGGTASANLPIICMTPGSAGNAAASQINTLASALPGIDTVTNAATLTNGEDAETDAAFRARFVLFLGALSDATMVAVENAVLSVQDGVSCVVVENTDYTTGNEVLGEFYVVVDDGSGDPASGFLTLVYNAVNAVRPLAVQFSVHGPTLVTANVSMTLTLAAGYDPTTTATAVEAAISAYISALGLGNGLPYSRLSQIAYGVSAGITNVTSVLLNSGTSDLPAVNKDTIKPGTITASVA